MARDVIAACVISCELSSLFQTSLLQLATLNELDGKTEYRDFLGDINRGFKIYVTEIGYYVCDRFIPEMTVPANTVPACLGYMILLQTPIWFRLRKGGQPLPTSRPERN